MHDDTGHKGHEELVDEGDPELGGPGGVGEVHQGVADARRETAGEGAEKEGGEDAHGVAHGEGGLAQGAGDRDADELGQDKDAGGKDADQDHVMDGKGFVFHIQIHSGLSFGVAALLTGAGDDVIIPLSGSIGTVRTEIFYGISWRRVCWI